MLTLDRDTFKKIKHYSKEEMTIFLDNTTKDAYNCGFIKGHEVGATKYSNQISDAIQEALKQTKGIGQKRSDEIIKNITAILHKKIEK